MRKILLTSTSILLLAVNVMAQANNAMAPANFVTKWLFTSATTSLQINALTTGAGVNYTWSASPSGNNGTASFTQTTAGAVTLTINAAANDTITLQITPTDLNRFYMTGSPDVTKLINVTNWGASNWTSMEQMFMGCSNMDVTATNTPKLSGANNMYAMFSGCFNLQGPANINSWNTSTIQYMDDLFKGCFYFNQDISSWNTSNVVSLQNTFSSAFYFNQPIGSWDVSKVTSLYATFENAHYFNQPLNLWNTSNVFSTSFTFKDASTFNQNINSWNMSKINNMIYMFGDAVSFNQPLDNWDMSNVADCQSAFYTATAFNQSLANWDLDTNVNLIGLFDYSGIDCDNYSATLKAWSTNPATPDSITLGAAGLNYGTTATAAHDSLINKGWTIVGDTAGLCTTPTNIKNIGTNTLVNIYPNPANIYITVHATTPLHHFTITNILGVEVLSVATTNSEAKIDISTLTTGIYFATVNGVTQKFIKE